MNHDILEHIEYSRIITNAQNRESMPGYYEKHHIIPKCLGGSDDKSNIVKLTAKEHYEAHKILCEIRPNNQKLWFAWGMMAFLKSPGQKRDIKITSDDYQKIKENLNQKGEKHPSYGHKKSEKAREAIRQSKIGDKNPMKRPEVVAKKRAFYDNNKGRNAGNYGKGFIYKEVTTGFIGYRLDCLEHFEGLNSTSIRNSIKSNKELLRGPCKGLKFEIWKNEK